MMKRPFFLAAALLVFVIFILYHIDQTLFLPDCSFVDREEILLVGEVEWMNRKKDTWEVFLRNVQVTKPRPVSIPSVLLTMEEETNPQNLRIGNRILVKGEHREFSAARNEGNFDERMYYYAEGIFLRVKVREIAVTDASFSGIRQAIYAFRGKMISSIYDVASDEETAAILAAICAGDRSGLTDETRRLYQHSGIAHILAVSGLHISFIGMRIFRLLRKRIRTLTAAFWSLLVMTGFCMLSGASPSSIRATIMFFIQIGGALPGRKYDLLNALSIAAILLLCENPLYIFHSGFQLSFVAVLSVGVLYPQLSQGLLLLFPDKEGFGRRVLSGFLMSLSVTLGTLPLIAGLYYEIPVYAIFWNLLILPLMGTVLSSGLAGALLGTIHLLPGRFFSGIGVYLVAFIRFLCSINESLPYSIVVTGAVDGWRAGIYYGALLLGSCLFARFARNRKQVLGIIFPLLITTGLLIAFLFFRIPDGRLKISFLDVGQGESILLHSPDGMNLLIDGGSTSVSSPGKYRISSAVKYQGIGTLDYVIVTHPDTDHCNGILEILEGMPSAGIEPFTAGTGNLRIRYLLLPAAPGNDNYEKIVSLAAEKGVPTISLSRGMTLCSGELHLTCLHPPENFRHADSNEYSAVLDVRFGDFSALFTGDLGEEGERLLLHDTEGPFDLLKVAHHGSRYSSSREFLEMVSPGLAVISAGVGNRYGHPHEETLKRLHQTGADIYVTADCGEIMIFVDRAGNQMIRTMLGQL